MSANGFFDGDHSQFSARSHPHSSAPPDSTFLGRLFYRNPSDAHDTSPSSPLDWAQNLLKPHRQIGEEIELQGRNPAAVEVPCVGANTETLRRRRLRSQNRNKIKPLHSKESTTGSPKLNVAKPSSQSQAADSSPSTTCHSY